LGRYRLRVRGFDSPQQSVSFLSPILPLMMSSRDEIRAALADVFHILIIAKSTQEVTDQFNFGQFNSLALSFSGLGTKRKHPTFYPYRLGLTSERTCSIIET
jgi:hypothetical protein